MKHMKNVLKKYFPLMAAAAVLASLCFPQGCANTTTPPSGGPKDTIPPVIRKITPLPGAAGVSTKKTRIEFTFDEYVQVKDPRSLFLSPPGEKQPKFKMKGKTLVVYFEDDLDSNRTHTLDLTGAVADNNEGNMFPGYVFVFSTGGGIDSMMVTGIVQDCNTLMPVKGATVMLYKDRSDSALFKHRPDAAARTDDWGYFALRNIQDTVYRIYAIEDQNNNNMYDPDNERVAFLDTLFRPAKVAYDSLPELLKYDMKDTANCLARHQELELSMFREQPSRQYIDNYVRTGERSAYVTFMAPGAEIKGMRIRGLPADKLITQFNPERDSLELWVNDQRRMPDTLYLMVNYMKTDTSGVLVPTEETVKLAMDAKMKTSASKSKSSDIRHEDTVCVMTASAKPETVEQYGFSLEFKYPLIREAFDSLHFYSINPRQQEREGAFRLVRDTANIRRFSIMPEEKLLPGWEYILKIPHRMFQDINGHFNDSTQVKVSLPTDEKLSSLNMILAGVDREYIVELLNEKRSEVLRKYVTDSSCTLAFPYLAAGKYSVRITEDPNRNGIVDTGNLLGKRQPEKAVFYKINDSFLIEIPERSVIDQRVDMQVLFNGKEKDDDAEDNDGARGGDPDAADTLPEGAGSQG